MKSINKILSTLFVLCLSIGFVACSEDEAEYTPNPDILTKDKTAYFPASFKENLDIFETSDTLRIEINRIDATEAQTIPIVLNDTSGLFQNPKGVNFGKGQMNTTLKIPYNNIQKGVTYSLDLAIDEAYAFKYAGVINYTLKTGVNWLSLGMASYTDDFLTKLFGLNPVTYEVEIHESVATSGVYRLVDPYGKNFPNNKEGDYDASQIYYLEINASDPDGVYIERQKTGLNWGYGIFNPSSLAYHNYLSKGKTLADAKAAGVCGTLKEGVITFPTNSLVTVLGSSAYLSNANGAFKVILPTK